jgi:hypothetical protein
MARTPPRRSRQTCVTVEQDGVWIYANPDGLRTVADYANALAASESSEHHEFTCDAISGRTAASRRESSFFWTRGHERFTVETASRSR